MQSYLPVLSFVSLSEKYGRSENHGFALRCHFCFTYISQRILFCQILSLGALYENRNVLVKSTKGIWQYLPERNESLEVQMTLILRKQLENKPFAHNLAEISLCLK